MNKTNTNNQSFDQNEMAQLFKYPSIGELFSDDSFRQLEDFRKKLFSTRENLERIIRYGKQQESESATQALRAVELTLEFLQTLQNMRVSG